MAAAALKPHHLKIFFSNQYCRAQIVRITDGHIVADACSWEKPLKTALQSTSDTVMPELPLCLVPCAVRAANAHLTRHRRVPRSMPTSTCHAYCRSITCALRPIPTTESNTAVSTKQCLAGTGRGRQGRRGAGGSRRQGGCAGGALGAQAPTEVPRQDRGAAAVHASGRPAAALSRAAMSRRDGPPVRHWLLPFCISAANGHCWSTQVKQQMLLANAICMHHGEHAS